MLYFRNKHFKQATERNIKKYIDFKMYSEFGGFEKWYKKFHKLAKNGLYVSECWKGDTLIGVSILNPDVTFYGCYNNPAKLYFYNDKKFIVAGISGVYVDPKFRKKGIGKKLYQNLINFYYKKNNKATHYFFIVSGLAVHIHKKSERKIHPLNYMTWSLGSSTDVKNDMVKVLNAKDIV